MPFVQRFVEPKYLSRTNLFDEDGNPRVADEELQAVTNNTLCSALRQLASLVLVADDIFNELGGQLRSIHKRSEAVKVKISVLEEKVIEFDPKKVTVPESDICSFALLKNHYAAKQEPDTALFGPESRPAALRALYDAANKTPVHLMRQLDRWRRDGHRTSRFFLCTPVLGAKRRKIRNKVDIDIETRMPASVEELRRWTSDEAVGDITVTPDCASRIAPSNVSSSVFIDGDTTDGTLVSDDEGVDHKLPSPEEQLQVVALRFPAEIVAVDVSGRSFDRMSMHRRSVLHAGKPIEGDPAAGKRSKTRNRRPRSRRRNTLAGTDQKEIRDALTGGEEAASPLLSHEIEPAGAGTVCRSKSSDLLRSASKKDSPEAKKSHFNTLKQWGKSRYDKLMNKSSDSKTEPGKKKDDDNFSIYETVVSKRKRDLEKERRTHERNSSVSSSDKSSVNVPVSDTSVAVKLRESATQRRQRRSGGNKDEPHSSSGNWSASSESGRASIGSEITSTTHPKSTTSTATSSNSLNHQPRRFTTNTSTSSSVTSEGTLTPDIIHDLHEDGETSSVYSCDTEGYYTSFHMDSGLKTLKEEESPPTPLHSTTAFSNSGSNNTVLSAENEYELFGRGSTSTTTSSAGTVCTTLRASESSKSLTIGPAVPERKSSLNKSAESSLERDFSDKTGTVKRSPGSAKPTVVGLIHKKHQGDVSPDSGHNTSSSPIESISSPNGVRSGSDFEFSESSDMEGPERIERIRVKTTINSSRIPSMCVITPPHSDDESVNSTSDFKLDSKTNDNAPSPSGGTVTIKEAQVRTQPVIKSLLPLNNVFGRIKTNLANLTRSKSPVTEPFDAGEYVTIADVRNNNDEKATYVNDVINRNLNTVLSGKVIDSEYVSLNELPGTDTTNLMNHSGSSLERKRQGARVTLDAEGKVVYSSDSLRRRKALYTTFEPGPHVKPKPSDSPLPQHRSPKIIRPIANSQNQMVAAVDAVEFNRPLSPQSDKYVIRASSNTAEIIRMPPSTIVAATTSPKPLSKGAYVHIQDAGATQEKERVPSPTVAQLPVGNTVPGNPELQPLKGSDMYRYQHTTELDIDNQYHLSNKYYSQMRGNMYSTLPPKKTQFFTNDYKPERSVTPDITRGLERNYNISESEQLNVNYLRSLPRNFYKTEQNALTQKLGIPVRIPDVDGLNMRNVPSISNESLKISPIDPRHSHRGFQSSTPTSKLVAVSLTSPKKSTMSNEELYAVIHKSKKRMNIDTEQTPRSSPVTVESPVQPKQTVKSPETGYLGDKSRSRLSWSPNKGDYVDFNCDIDKLSPPNESRSRQSWACSDRKGPKSKQTSTIDFKRLLLQKSSSTTPKKFSAVEQLRLSKDQIKPPQPKSLPDMSILDLSGSPRSRRLVNNLPGSPSRDVKPAPKILSPRSQWRFANPRSDVLSSTILEDCREDESPNSSGERRKSSPKFNEKETLPLSASQKLQAQRAQFFNITQENQSLVHDKSCPPTLETAF